MHPRYDFTHERGNDRVPKVSRGLVSLRSAICVSIRDAWISSKADPLFAARARARRRRAGV